MAGKDWLQHVQTIELIARLEQHVATGTTISPICPPDQEEGERERKKSKNMEIISPNDDKNGKKERERER